MSKGHTELFSQSEVSNSSRPVNCLDKHTKIDKITSGSRVKRTDTKFVISVYEKQIGNHSIQVAW